jgi:protein-S-isoprenylcysteine O-methyltransferase Ste14
MLYFKSKRSAALIIIQFTFIGLIFAVGNSIPSSPLMIVLLFIASLPGLIGILQMKWNVNIPPDVRNNSSLIQTGIYKFIRHPMYFSVLSVCLVSVLNDISTVRILFFIILFFTILLKHTYEEHLLTEAYGEKYIAYQKTTKRFIPFIF